MMIFVMVTFVPHQKSDMPVSDRMALFERTAPKYQIIPGLIRKYFIGQKGGRAGGAYEFDTLDSARAYFTPTWEKFITDTYGSDLRVEYYDAPCVVDNDSMKIVIDPHLKSLSTASAAE